MSTQARARTRTAWGWSCPRALARVCVEVGGPGVRVATVTGEVADRVAELLSAPQQKLMTSTLPDWRVEGATPARQASKRRWGTGRGRRRRRTRAHLRSPPGHRPARSTVEVHDESCEVRWPRARRLAKGLCAIERRSVSDDQGCGSGVMPGLPSPVEASSAVCAEKRRRLDRRCTSCPRWERRYPVSGAAQPRKRPTCSQPSLPLEHGVEAPGDDRDEDHAGHDAPGLAEAG